MKKLTASLILTAAFLYGNFSFAETPILDAPAQQIQQRDFSCLFSTLNGISDELLKQHFQLYQGYVTSLNNLNTELKTTKNHTGNATYSKYRAVVISKPFAQNGIVLHELYFSNLSGKQSAPSEALNKYLIRDFGSYENYISELKEAAKSARSGWVITGFNDRDGKIYNYIIDLHDEHMPLAVMPILVFDVWEHAYVLDYGIDKSAYIDTFIKNIDWNAVSKRLEALCE